MPQEPDSDLTPEELIARIVADKGDIKLSLHRVLRGFITAKGGPEKWGEEMAEMSSDIESNMSARVSINNNMAKLLGQCAEDKEDDKDASEEEIEAILRNVK